MMGGFLQCFPALKICSHGRKDGIRCDFSRMKLEEGQIHRKEFLVSKCIHVQLGIVIHGTNMLVKGTHWWCISFADKFRHFHTNFHVQFGSKFLWSGAVRCRS